jgi:uncharacterized protein (UPF0218 family)
MVTVYNLRPELREKLKKPLGILIRGSFNETMTRFKAMLENKNPPYVVSVGDTVSRNLQKNNIFPQLSITDNLVMRKRISSGPITARKVVHVKNPPATITGEAITAIQDSLRERDRTRIIVDGEEDLLALIAILNVPDNSFVIYGQPHEGIVVVEATEAKKKEIADILKAMEKAGKAK